MAHSRARASTEIQTGSKRGRWGGRFAKKESVEQPQTPARTTGKMKSDVFSGGEKSCGEVGKGGKRERERERERVNLHMCLCVCVSQSAYVFVWVCPCVCALLHQSNCIAISVLCLSVCRDWYRQRERERQGNKNKKYEEAEKGDLFPALGFIRQIWMYSW